MKARHMWCNSLLSYRYLLLTSKNDASIHNPRSMTTQVNSYSLHRLGSRLNNGMEQLRLENAIRMVVSRLRLVFFRQGSKSNCIQSNPNPKIRVCLHAYCEVLWLRQAAQAGSRFECSSRRLFLSILTFARLVEIQSNPTQSEPIEPHRGLESS